MSSSIVAESDGIGHFISDHDLTVPAYQRPYSWKKEQVTQLLEDITTAFENGDEYFLGSLVLINGGGSRISIVDGQQRLATITILLSTIRDYFQDNDAASGRHADIEKDFLYKKHRRSRESDPRLVLSDSNNELFQRIIERDTVSPTSKSEKQMVDALRICTEHIQTMLKPITPTRRIDKLLDFIEFIELKVEIISVITPDDANAFTIFETLNDRGLPLSLADLVKNYLFGLAGNRLEEVKTNWHVMSGAFRASDSEEQLVDYMSHYWASKYSYSSRPKIFNEIKAKVTSKQQAVDFIKELAESSRNYLALQNASDPTWQVLGPQAQRDIETLIQLRLEQHKPLMLSVMRNLTPRNQSKMIGKIVNWSVRLIVTGGTRSGSVSKNISSVSIDIENKVLSTVSAITNAMKKIVPDNKAFEDSFASLRVSKGYMAKYLLTSIESTKRIASGLSPELAPSESINAVNIEHILPKNPNLSDWSFNVEEAGQYLTRLGNQAILSSVTNSTIGAADFSTKKPFLAKSELLTTKSVATAQDWNPGAVDARQVELAKLAVKTWPI